MAEKNGGETPEDVARVRERRQQVRAAVDAVLQEVLAERTERYQAMREELRVASEQVSADDNRVLATILNALQLLAASIQRYDNQIEILSERLSRLEEATRRSSRSSR